MEKQNKRLLLICLFLAGLLSGLVYIRYQYFGLDYLVRFKVAKKTDKRGKFDYTADTSLYHFTSHEGRFPASTSYFIPEFITYFPKKVGDWVGRDFPNQYADISLFRQYKNKKTDDVLWLIIVSGGHESQFHSAEVCYIVDGWKISKSDVRKVKMKKETFPIRYLVAKKGKNVHLVNYWFVWKTSRRNIGDGVLLFRISLESRGSEARTETAFKNFLGSLSNLIMEVPRGKGAVTKPSEKWLPEAPKAAPPVVIKQTGKKLKEAQAQALKWILSQRVPNHSVPYPHIDRRYLFLSYELNPEHPTTENDRSYRYIFSRSAVYDDALVLIAMTMFQKYREAERLIEAFERLVRPDGTLWFSYNTHNNWPSKWDHEEAIIRNGASAWVGYAMTYYLRRRLLEDPKGFRKQKKYSRYMGIVKKIADAILKDQILDLADPRIGVVTGGMGSFNMARDNKTDRVIERFEGGKVKWASIEHNLDVYFFLKNVATLTKEKRYQVASQQVKRGLLRAWNESEGQFNRGIRLDGPDKTMALDCASWGLMFALSIGAENKRQALMNALKKYEIKDPLTKVRGYRPYYKGLVFDELEINKLFYPHRPEKSWSEIQMVWSEGSLGVAMAYLKAGNREKAVEIVKHLIAMQTPSGGVRYSTQEIPFQFSPSPSMAGTAWLAMVLRAMEDPLALDLFWD